MKNEKGFSAPQLLFGLVVIALIGFVGWQVATHKPGKKHNQTAAISTSSDSGVTWSFNGTSWQANDTPPKCPEPILQTPIDVNKATAVLYPGQTRGGNYKAHGGFIFKGIPNNEVTVTVPIDAVVYKGSRYIEQDEVQNFFVFIAPCGIMYRFDHLLTLSPEFQKIADTLPKPEVNNSATTNFNPAPKVKAGDIVATGVGFKNTGNTSVDFGVYDLRQQNVVSKTAAWQSAHPNDNEFGKYGVCWFDLLPTKDAATVKALPPGDQMNGATSDYCK